MGLSRYGKLQVAAEVVKLWRSQSPAGRFLTMTNPSQRDDTAWHDIGDKEAIKKTSQCLRERIPPNQKARTLPTVSKKAKALVAQSKKTTSKLHELTESQEQQQQQQQESHFSQWLQQQESSMQQTNGDAQQQQERDDCQPRPLLEPATVSVSSSCHLVTPLDAYNNSNKTLHTRKFSLSAPSLPQHIDSGRQESISDDGSDLGAWMSDIRDRTSSESSGSSEPLTLTSSALMHHNHSQNNNQTQVQAQETLLIPSAANLTRDAFDDDDHEPTRSFSRMDSGASSTNRSFFRMDSGASCASGPIVKLKEQESLDRFAESMSNMNMTPTTLNQSISSGFNDLFSW